MILVFLAISLTTILWIDSNGCFSTQSDLKNTLSQHFQQKRFTVDLIDDSKREITPTILFCLDHLLFNPLGVNNAHLLLNIYLDFKE